MKRQSAKLRIPDVPHAIARISQALYAANGRIRGGLSVDALDAVIRTIAILVVVALSVARVLMPGDGMDGSAESSTLLAAALLLVLYHAVVVALIGVPWRTKPGEKLFAVDGLVAAVAVTATGGIFSPFIVLTYALVIGATLRLPSPRPRYALLGAALVLIVAAIVGPEGNAPKSTILVVELTSLLMVSITSQSLKRTIEIGAERAAMEENQLARLRLLSALTNEILTGSLDTASVLKTVARAAALLPGADRALAVLADRGARGELVRTSASTDPVVLTAHERDLAEAAIRFGSPRSVRTRNDAGKMICELAISVPVDEELHTWLLLSRAGNDNFSQADISLFSSFTQQMAVGVRLARLYESERKRAIHSEERERLERDLLSLVSHDLRTPLTAIQTCAEALSEVESAPVVAQRLAQNINRNSDRLSNMVDDLLDLAKIRHGRVTLEMHAVNVGEVISALESELLRLVAQKEQYIVLDLPSRGTPRWTRLNCSIDRNRIEQVLINLFTNAQKFSPPGGTITIGVTERGGEIRVFVRDLGRGLSKFEQERIFDAYYRGSQVARAGDSPGLGLGLAIARSLVELHGGTLGVESRPGAGSTFHFTLRRCTELQAAAKET